MFKIPFFLKEFKFKNNQAALFVLALLYSVALFSQDQEYFIDDPEDLRNVIYKPGDVIILKDGIYTTDERMIFLGSGTAEKPVTFRAETSGGVIFNNGPRLTIGGESDGSDLATGEYLVVDGFHWKNGYGASNFIEFRNGNDYAHHSTIQNCVIDNLGVEPSELAEDLADEQIPKHRWIVLYGTYNTVINCSFMNKVTAGAIILGEYSYNAFPNVPDGEPEINDSCRPVGHTIANNYFYNYEKITELYPYTKANGDPYSNSGDSETIRIGTSSYQMVNSNVTVSNNYFVKSDGENEIITNKSKGNTFTNNTFRECRGSLVLRHGSYATVDGNYFLGGGVEGTGGIRITDSEHTITNNYIQDCVTKNSNAKWNNGITFIGGNEDADIACGTDDVSNGYQESKNITLSNNTIVNTFSPLFYNEDKGSEDPTGTVSNNLIYFEAADPNLTDVVSGDSANAFANLGTALTYSGNVYTGTMLGATTTGFSEETGITATPDGEIFTFSGVGATGKGADMGAYAPTTNEMVGYGIGACFVDYNGDNILDGECTIEVLESLTVSSLSPLAPEAGSYDVTVNANVSWTADDTNDDWISIDVTSGTGNATVSVTVTENTDTSSRVGTVIFTQDPGGDDIVRTLTVTQQGVDPRTGLNLINDGSANDNVSINYVFAQEITSTKNNIAVHCLDKDFDTQWSGQNVGGVPGEIIFDLGGAFDLELIDYASTNGKRYEFQIWVSSTTDNAGAFTNAFPGEGNLVCETQSDEFKSFVLPATAIGTKYVKIIGYGQPARPSDWNTIVEIEFYGSQNLSVDENQLESSFLIYPNPVNDELYINSKKTSINSITMYSLDGRKVFEKPISSPMTEMKLDVSFLENGPYLINLSGKFYSSQLKMIIVSH